MIVTHFSPEKRLTEVLKTNSLLRFPISVGRDPEIKKIRFYGIKLYFSVDKKYLYTHQKYYILPEKELV